MMHASMAEQRRMRAMPYKLQQGKEGVVEISQIPAKWKSLDKFQQEQQQQQKQEQQFQVFSADNNINNNNTSSRTTSSSVESEPTSTLDTTRRSPSPPTSTSTLSSSFTGKNNSSSDNIAAGVADPTCASEIHHRSDNVAATGVGGGGSGIGLEEWDSLFPNGDGALLPWIMGDPDDPGLGLKHLLHSAIPNPNPNPNSVVVEFEGNAGLGVVDQVAAAAAAASNGLESLSSPPPHLPPQHSHHVEGGFEGNGNGGGGGSISSSSSPNCVPTNGFNLTHLLGGGGGGGGGCSMPMSMPFPPQFDVGGGGGSGDEKPQIFNPQLVMNQQQSHSIANPSFLMNPATALGGYCQQLDQFQPQAKRHNPGVVLNPFLDQGQHELLLRKQQQQMGLGLQQQMAMMMPKSAVAQFGMPIHHLQHQQLQEQGVKDQLFKAADLIQTGNFSLAQEILARLNHQLTLPAKPLIRAALYVKEALQMLLQLGNPVAAPTPKMLTPYDVVHKMNAYKVFSEVSPITQFVNFTCTQAILEALDDADAIHIIDFDVGCGAQWASLIQELPLRKRGAPSLQITAVASPTTHTFELALVRENLVQFANDAGVAFELQVVNLDSFDPSSSSFPNLRTSEDECIAVSIPIWSSSTRPSILPSLLRFVKQRSPKIVVSLDRGFDRCDVPFPQHLIHSLESCTSFLESLDGLNVTSDIVSKVEKFFVQPRIENTVLGRLHAPDKMPHWKNLFASAGLVPVQFSNFTETQADYVVKRSPNRGFHVEKRQASLVLSWQRRELVAASAWRC